MIGLATLSRALLAILVLLALAGCERDVVTTDYFPMRDGNRWEFRLLDRPMLQRLAAGEKVETQEAISAEPPDDAPPKAEVLNEEAKAEAKGKILRARRVALVLKESVDELTYRATYDGFEQVWSKRGGYAGFQDARGRHYLLILPPHTTYRWIVTDPAGQNLFFEIEGQQDVTTPAGTFARCAVSRQETRDKREAFRFWFAPEVGLVRRSKYYLDEEVFRQELVAKDVRASTPDGRAAEDREIRQALKGKKRGTEYQQSSARLPQSIDEMPAP